MPSSQTPRPAGEIRRPPGRVGRRTLLGALAGAAAAAGAASWWRGDIADRRPTDGSWRSSHLDRFLDATESPVAATNLAVAVRNPSVEVGRPVIVLASSADHRAVDVAVFRLGWYDGVGARLIEGRSAVAVRRELGVVAEVLTDGWRSGLYVAATRTSGSVGFERLCPFVVTDSASRSPVVLQIPVATYQAYNAWGGASLYEFNSPHGPATNVRLDRPFDVFDGTGFLYYGDLHLVWWLEREGVDVTYASSVDTHRNPGLMDGRRLFLAGFHDEYWSTSMRDHLEDWLGGGVNAVFLSANNIYWQVEFSDDDSTMWCDKADGGPQGRFRDSGRPEALLLGSQYESYRFPYGTVAADWVVVNGDHWLYHGTGLRGGDRIDRLVGYEWDRLPDDRPAPGVTVVADSPVDTDHRHHACIVEHSGGGIVFNAGTNYWPRLLLGGGHWAADRHVQSITRNLINRLG